MKIHDSLCPSTNCPDCDDVVCDYCGGCRCELISNVRENERNKLLPAHWSQDWHLGYRQGVADTEKKFRNE